MRWHAPASKAYDFLLLNVWNGSKESEPSPGEDYEPEEYSCGVDGVEGELAYSFLHNRSSRDGVAERGKQQKR